MKILKKILIAILLIVIVLAAATIGYCSVYYHASDSAKAVITEEHEGVTITEGKDTITFAPDDADTGIIFYPGGKVEYTAYAPLMESLAEKGFLCVLVHMPANLAVFKADAADGITEQYPEIESWYMAGHSLGGVMAASYIADHTDEFDGIIFLASYTSTDLSDTDLYVLSIFGTNDGVLDIQAESESHEKLPRFMQDVIEGGCHAYFGDYGEQRGDGIPTITREDQIQRTADTIYVFINYENEK